MTDLMMTANMITMTTTKIGGTAAANSVSIAMINDEEEENEGPDINISKLVLVNNVASQEWKRSTPLKTYSKKNLNTTNVAAVSRYGRSHKPRIADDFLSTDKKVSQYLKIDTDNQLHYFKSSPYSIYKSPNSKSSISSGSGSQQPSSSPRKRGRPPKIRTFSDAAGISSSSPLNSSPANLQTENPVVPAPAAIDIDAADIKAGVVGGNGGEKLGQNILLLRNPLLKDLNVPTPTSTETLPIPPELMDQAILGTSDSEECDTLAEVEESLDSVDQASSCLPGTTVEMGPDGQPRWMVGDLAWAFVGGFPYWPCTVTRDPFENAFTKLKFVGKFRQARDLIHVRFFGDHGRRSWIYKGNILPFQGLDSFLNLAEQKCNPKTKKKFPKQYRSFTVTASNRKAWQAAVSEAESLKEAPRSERVKYFIEAFPSPTQPQNLQQYSNSVDNKRRNSLQPVKENHTKLTPRKRKSEMALNTNPAKHFKEDIKIKDEPVDDLYSANNMETSVEQIEEDVKIKVEGEPPATPVKKVERRGRPRKDGSKSGTPLNQTGLVVNLAQSVKLKKETPTRGRGRPRKYPKNEEPLMPSTPTETTSINSVLPTPPASAGKKKMIRCGVNQMNNKKRGGDIVDNSIIKTNGSVTDKKLNQSINFQLSTSTEQQASGTVGDNLYLQDRKKCSKLGPGFASFCEKHFDQVADEEPTLTSNDVGKYLEKMWSQLSDAVKARYRSKTQEENEIESGSDTETDSRRSPPQTVITAGSKPIKRGVSLFSGVKSDKVCSVCFKSGETGEVIKCKGPCCNYFHIECSNLPRYQQARFLPVPLRLKKKGKRGRPRTVNIISPPKGGVSSESQKQTNNNKEINQNLIKGNSLENTSIEENTCVVDEDPVTLNDKHLDTLDDSTSYINTGQEIENKETNNDKVEVSGGNDDKTAVSGGVDDKAAVSGGDDDKTAVSGGVDDKVAVSGGDDKEVEEGKEEEDDQSECNLLINEDCNDINTSLSLESQNDETVPNRENIPVAKEINEITQKSSLFQKFDDKLRTNDTHDKEEAQIEEKNGSTEGKTNDGVNQTFADIKTQCAVDDEGLNEKSDENKKSKESCSDGIVVKSTKEVESDEDKDQQKSVDKVSNESAVANDSLLSTVAGSSKNEIIKTVSKDVEKDTTKEEKKNVGDIRKIEDEDTDNKTGEEEEVIKDTDDKSNNVKEGKMGEHVLVEHVIKEEESNESVENKVDGPKLQDTKTEIKRELSMDDKQSIDSDKSLTSKPGWICGLCVEGKEGPCFICGTDADELTKCSTTYCGKVYHMKCLTQWPQRQIGQGAKGRLVLYCPQHTCHTCISDNPAAHTARFSSDKLVRCVACPSSYHYGNYCIPAGSELLSSTQMICPRHYVPLKDSLIHINASWCSICAIGGSLICCDTCPNSFHAECLKIDPPEGSFICEDCETGRIPLYGEVVWVKLGAYRWWPAKILYPYEVPENIRTMVHSPVGEFVVEFFGSHDYFWINRGRAFFYHEGDGANIPCKSRVDELFITGMNEASEAFRQYQEERESREANSRPSMKPPKYVKIQTNRPYGTLRSAESDVASMTACECDPEKENPCGRNSDCINRLLMVECNPQICPAGDKCQNQNFEKRLYPPLTPFKTETRGWGLKTLVPLKKGDFVIEYVGEMIDEEEYKKRVIRKQKNKDENYYFLTIDKDRMLDAGPKGNMARFMNHSCNPNCETQKWTVNGDTRVGLFTLVDIPDSTELVFNYNLETIGNTRVDCKCGAPFCGGYIGAKVSKQQQCSSDEKKASVSSTSKKKKQSRKSIANMGGGSSSNGNNSTSGGTTGNNKNSLIKVTENTCFTCGEGGELLICDHNSCPKAYHLDCLGLTKHPPGNWECPRHVCSICSSTKVQRCTHCINSYCDKHSEGNITVHRTHGLVCFSCTPSESGSDWSGGASEEEENNKKSDLPQQTKSKEYGGSSSHNKTNKLLTSRRGRPLIPNGNLH